MAYYDDVKTTKIAYIGFISVISTVIIVMLLQVLYFQTRLDQAAVEESTAGPPMELANLTATQQTALTRVEVVDREKGIVTVGIKRAMDLVITELDAGSQPNDVVGPLGPPIPSATEGPAAAAASDDQAKDEADEQAAAKTEQDAEDDDAPEKLEPPENTDEDKS
jgi:hypothetical protein